MKTIYLVATWAYCILIGCLLITPAGFTWININPATSKIIGGIFVAFGVVGIIIRKTIFNDKVK